MNEAYLLTGGNLGNRMENLARAGKLIEQHCGKIVHSSAVYESEAWGYQDQPSFYNQALQIETQLSAPALMSQLLLIEKEMGRTRTIHMGPRIVDLDILFFDGIVINEPDLIIPHPRIHLRRFVLVPMSEIAAGFIHPVLQKSIATLLQECPDQLNVHKIQ